MISMYQAFLHTLFIWTNQEIVLIYYHYLIISLSEFPFSIENTIAHSASQRQISKDGETQNLFSVYRTTRAKSFRNLFLETIRFLLKSFFYFNNLNRRPRDIQTIIYVHHSLKTFFYTHITYHQYISNTGVFIGNQMLGLQSSCHSNIVDCKHLIPIYLQAAQKLKALLFPHRLG